jgi:glutamine synthetase
MIKRQIIPAEIAYMNELADAYNSGKQAGVEVKTAKDILEKVNDFSNKLSDSIIELEKDIKEVRAIKDNKEKAFAYRDRVKVRMEEARFYSDELERITDKAFWPIPSYGDLLFEV